MFVETIVYWICENIRRSTQPMNQRFLAITILISATLAFFVVYFALPATNRSLSDLITYYGLFLGLYGLWLTYLQIASLKESSEKAQIAVSISLLRINQVLSVAELSKGLKIVQEIQVFIRHGKHELALLRMKDLKHLLIAIKSNQDLSEYTHAAIYNKHITDLGIDINNTNDVLLGQNKRHLNFSKVNQNLEDISTVLAEFETKLKMHRHDT